MRRAFGPSCTDATVASSECASAVHRWCIKHEFYVTGFGPIEHNPKTGEVTFVCLASGQSKVFHTTYTGPVPQVDNPGPDNQQQLPLQHFHSSCYGGKGEHWGGDCMFAADHFCREMKGAVSGFGPVENSGNSVTVVCTY
jgi:hypothetical protein